MKKILSMFLAIALLLSTPFALTSLACDIKGAHGDSIVEIKEKYIEKTHKGCYGFKAYPVRNGRIVTADGSVFTSEVSDCHLTTYIVTKNFVSGEFSFRWHIYNEDKSVEFLALVFVSTLPLNAVVDSTNAHVDKGDYDYIEKLAEKGEDVIDYETWKETYREEYDIVYGEYTILRYYCSNKFVDQSKEYGYIEKISDELLLELYQLASYTWAFEPVPKQEVFACKSIMTVY